MDNEGDTAEKSQTITLSWLNLPVEIRDIILSKLEFDSLVLIALCSHATPTWLANIKSVQLQLPSVVASHTTHFIQRLAGECSRFSAQLSSFRNVVSKITRLERLEFEGQSPSYSCLPTVEEFGHPIRECAKNLTYLRFPERLWPLVSTPDAEQSVADASTLFPRLKTLLLHKCDDYDRYYTVDDESLQLETLPSHLECLRLPFITKLEQISHQRLTTSPSFLFQYFTNLRYLFIELPLFQDMVSGLGLGGIAAPLDWVLYFLLFTHADTKEFNLDIKQKLITLESHHASAAIRYPAVRIIPDRPETHVAYFHPILSAFSAFLDFDIVKEILQALSPRLLQTVLDCFTSHDNQLDLIPTIAVAANSGHIRIVQELIQRGLDPTLRCGGKSLVQLLFTSQKYTTANSKELLGLCKSILMHPKVLDSMQDSERSAWAHPQQLPPAVQCLGDAGESYGDLACQLLLWDPEVSSRYDTLESLRTHALPINGISILALYSPRFFKWVRCNRPVLDLVDTLLSHIRTAAPAGVDEKTAIHFLSCVNQMFQIPGSRSSVDWSPFFPIADRIISEFAPLVTTATNWVRAMRPDPFAETVSAFKNYLIANGHHLIDIMLEVDLVGKDYLGFATPFCLHAWLALLDSALDSGVAELSEQAKLDALFHKILRDLFENNLVPPTSTGFNTLKKLSTSTPRLQLAYLEKRASKLFLATFDDFQLVSDNPAADWLPFMMENIFDSATYLRLLKATPPAKRTKEQLTFVIAHELMRRALTPQMGRPELYESSIQVIFLLFDAIDLYPDLPEADSSNASAEQLPLILNKLDWEIVPVHFRLALLEYFSMIWQSESTSRVFPQLIQAILSQSATNINPSTHEDFFYTFEDICNISGDIHQETLQWLRDFYH